MVDTSPVQILSTSIYFLLIFVSVIISVMGSILIISYLTRKTINVKVEIVKNKNIGLALVFGSFIWTIGRMCFESIKPIMNSWYNSYSLSFTFKTALLFVLGILLSLLTALLIGAISVYLSIKILMVITKDIDEWEEIKKGNYAVAVVMSMTIIVAGMFFESIISYLVMNVTQLFL